MSNDLINKTKRLMSRKSCSWTGTDSGSQLSAGETQIMRTPATAETVVDALSEQWVAPTNAPIAFAVSEYGMGAVGSGNAPKQTTDQHRSLKESIRGVVSIPMPAARLSPQRLIEASVAAISRSNSASFTGALIDEQDAMKSRQNAMLRRSDTPFQDVVNRTAEILRGKRGSTVITPNKVGAYAPARSGDQRKFANLHQVQRQDNPSNDDSLFQGATKPWSRRKHRYGYDNHDDEKAEFAADKSKQKQMIAAMAEEAQTIRETSLSQASKMATQLSDKFNEPFFIHSYDHPDVSGKKLYGVISQRHHSNDPDRDYKYHLAHIVHPTPPKPIKEATDPNGRKLRDDLTPDERERVVKFGSISHKSAGATRKKPVRQDSVEETFAKRQEEARLRQQQRHKAMCYGTEKELRDKVIDESDKRFVRFHEYFQENLNRDPMNLLCDSWDHSMSYHKE
jgi:hypothetical protein